MHSAALNLDESPEDRTLIGQTIEGKFTIRDVIGVGGTSLVYDAWHEVLQHPIAVKVLRSEFASEPELVAHFSLEGRVTAQLCGPHVVRVLDTGTLGSGVPYTVMERLRGESVANLIATHGALPPPLALELAIQACDALVEAHAHGIIHRDVKPDNLYIVDLPNGGQILKVIDFGIAQGTEIPTGLRKAGVGSAGYMAPEQICSPDRVDPRADIWGMGVVIFEMLTGRLPFRGTTVEELLASAERDEPLPIEVTAQGLPPELYAVVHACLRKDPTQRLSSMRQLQSDLERVRPQVQACKKPVALPLQLCELGRTLLPDSRAHSRQKGRASKGHARQGAGHGNTKGRQAVHRSGLVPRNNFSDEVPDTVDLAREGMGSTPSMARSLDTTSELDTLRPQKRVTTKIALSLAVALGLGIGTGLFDGLLRSRATALTEQSGAVGGIEMTTGSLPETTAFGPIAREDGTRPLTVNLELAIAERDTASAVDSTVTATVAQPPRARSAPQRPPALSKLKPPRPEPSFELLTPWTPND